MGHVLAWIEATIDVVVGHEGVDNEVDTDADDDHQHADRDDGRDAVELADGVPECVYR